MPSKIHTNTHPDVNRVEFASENPLGNAVAYVSDLKQSTAGIICLQEWWGKYKPIV